MSMHARQRGFTLLELIVIIVLVGIVAGLLVSFMGTKITSAPNVVLVSQREAVVERVMERILADYLVEINGANPDAALATIDGNESTYEALGALVDLDYVTFDGAGSEVASAGATSTLKVTVYVDPEGTGTVMQHRLTALLSQTRTNAGGEPVVNY